MTPSRRASQTANSRRQLETSKLLGTSLRKDSELDQEEDLYDDVDELLGEGSR